MKVSETAVICCPSGFTARWAGGACFSTVSNEAYTATTGCQLQFASRIETVLLETYTFYGRPITGLMAYTTATTMSFKTTIETIKPADSTQYIGLVTTPAVTLYIRCRVFKQDEFETAGQGAGASLGFCSRNRNCG
ncbi:hypothetical protein CGCSCA4_v000274 [Colletotrichum siamense]|uniref:Uncharacterized protein n=1 Tax=Colletotrichum siamense TaxID=690259 RepID=A0A9P5EXT3_COLSI|nr:hypothetical protein CGCSCA4_v000274 [Colletotrichum siamense]KAF4861957.1 hypothetical protein CGCSCA2_v004092 [Colletotrichum siamense]